MGFRETFTACGATGKWIGNVGRTDGFSLIFFDLLILLFTGVDQVMTVENMRVGERLTTDFTFVWSLELGN